MVGPNPWEKLHWVIIGLPRKDNHQGVTLSLIAQIGDTIFVTALFRWDNGKDIFDTSTKDLCLIPNKSNLKVHCVIIKWERYLN